MTLPRNPRLLVVALGGRALRLPTDTAEGWVDALEARLRPLVELIAAGFRLVVTAGARVELAETLHRTDLARRIVPPPPLDRILAAAQGVLGYAIQQALANGCRGRDLPTPVVSLMTRVLVDGADPAFARPSAPIGPPYPVVKGRGFAREAGWPLVEEAGLARRAAPAPSPLGVVEAPIVRTLVAAGVVPIAAGAGGIPVVATPDGYRPVEAVVDPDLVSATLAAEIAADRLVLLTGVPQAAVGFATSRVIGVAELKPSDARALLAAGEFPPTSMGPKVEAGLRFVEAGGREAIITALESLRAAIDGRAGTRVTR